MNDDLYQQEILHHFKNPQNYGELTDADLTITETNASCGDACTYYLKFDTDGQTIKQIKFTSTGCAISKAISSMLTDYAKGKTVEELKALNQEFMEGLLGSKVSPGRTKCLMLAAKAMKKAQPRSNK